MDYFPGEPAPSGGDYNPYASNMPPQSYSSQGPAMNPATNFNTPLDGGSSGYSDGPTLY
eukprot:EC785203.1.p3 GENE.EC785203.1~~EC785203.1.p3  ORF type:complete len:59 (+),score=18.65 EC785203.1:63-239(+)